MIALRVRVRVRAQSCPAPCHPMGCSPPGSSVHGIFQARVPQGVAISCSRRFSLPRDRTGSLASAALAGRFLTTAAAGKCVPVVAVARDKRRARLNCKWWPRCILVAAAGAEAVVSSSGQVFGFSYFTWKLNLEPVSSVPQILWAIEVILMPLFSATSQDQLLLPTIRNADACRI